MDYIYGKLDNNLVDINRIEYIQLKVCDLDNNPIEGLKVGQYYLETKIVDSNLLIYTDLSALNKDDDSITSKLEQEIQDRINQGNTLQTNINNEATRTDNMINQLNENVHSQFVTLNKILIDSINTINGGIEEETTRATQAEQQISDNLSQEIQNRKDAITNLSQALDSEISRATTKENLLETGINNEKDRATQAENTLQSNIDIEAQQRQEAVSTLTDRIAAEEVRAAAEEANLDKEIKAEAAERIDADNDLSQRIDNLEGKTTRLYYGEGTLSSPTATEIQQFITNLEVNPPYEPPYSGIAVVVKLTDENTYHIWHYYANLNAWKDDGVDLVNTFTNDFKGIIQGTTSVGYISAENGFGKVNGWSELNTTISNNYSTLNNKIDNSISAINTTISTLSTRLDTKIDKEISDRQTAISSLSQTLTASINNINITLSKAIADEVTRAKEAEGTLSTNISSVSSNLNTFINETAPNTYVKGSNLANQQIVLGAGGRNIKVSGKGIEEEQLSSSQSYVPTSQAVHNYVDPLFDDKVDKTTTSNVIYATTSIGTQSSIKYSMTNSGDSIVQRKSDCTIEAANPIGDGDFDVVNVNYLTNELSKKVNDITVSGNAEFVYSKNTNGNNTGILTSSNDGSDDASSKVTKYSIGGSLLVNLSDNLSEENKQRQAVPKSYVDEIKTTIDNEISSLSTSLSSTIKNHINNEENPHNVTKEQLGLGNVDNTSDLNKPISTATQKELDSIKETLSTLSSAIETLTNRVDSIDIYFEDLGEI